MFEDLFWFLVICVVVGSISTLLPSRSQKETENRQEHEDPNVFYYEDLHGHDHDDE